MCPGLVVIIVFCRARCVVCPNVLAVLVVFYWQTGVALCTYGKLCIEY